MFLIIETNEWRAREGGILFLFCLPEKLRNRVSRVLTSLLPSLLIDCVCFPGTRGRSKDELRWGNGGRAYIAVLDAAEVLLHSEATLADAYTAWGDTTGVVSPQLDTLDGLQGCD